MSNDWEETAASDGGTVAQEVVPVASNKMEGNAMQAEVDPATLSFYQRLDKTTLTALGCFWVSFISLIVALSIQAFFADGQHGTAHFLAVSAHWIFWGIAAISSAAALLFGRFREKVAALLLLTMVAVDLTYLILPIAAGQYGWIYKILRIFVDFDLLVAATYIATRKPRPKN